MMFLLQQGGGRIIIGNNVFVGVNSIILRNSSIGDNCIIGAGSVVCSTIPPNSVATGNPAKVIMSLDEFCEKRKKNALKEAVNEFCHYCDVHHTYPEASDLARFGFLFSYKNMGVINSMPSIGDKHEDFIKTYLRQKVSLTITRRSRSMQ